MTTLNNVFHLRYKGHRSCLCVGVCVCALNAVPARYVCACIYIYLYYVYMCVVSKTKYSVLDSLELAIKFDLICLWM